MALKRLTTRQEGMIRPYSGTLIQLSRPLDGLFIAVSLWASCLLRGQSWSVSYTRIAAVSFASFIVVAHLNNLYRSWRIAPFHEELSRIWRSWLATGLAVVFVLYLFDGWVVDKSVVLLWLAVAPLSLSATRAALRFGLRAARKSGRNFRAVAVVGATGIGRRIAERIQTNRWMGLRLLGYFDDRAPDGNRPLASGPVDILGTIDELVDRARAGTIDIVYVALPMRAEARIKELLDRLADTTASVYYVPDFSVFDLLYAQWETLGDVPVISIVDTPFYGVNGFVKRAQDIVLSTLFLGLAAVPMTAIAIAVKLSSKGPVLFRQRRNGLNGEEFEIWKFRTMAASYARDTFVQAGPEDARVTPLGALLRRTSLDELPQFINVLQGRMSIVGPRPHPLQLNGQHRHLIHRYMLRHKVRPGITGWAQVNGFRGETETPGKMEKRMEYDLEYINNWSMWLDLRIIAATVMSGFTGPNAY